MKAAELALAVVALVDAAARVRHADVRETRELGQCNDLRLAHLQVRRTDVVVLDYMRVGRDGPGQPLRPVEELVSVRINYTGAAAEHQCQCVADHDSGNRLPDPVEGQHTL